MANTNNTTSNFSLRMFLEKEKLTGVNFVDWHRQLRIILRHESKLHILEEPLPEPPASNANWVTRYAYEKRIQYTNEVSCFMLSTMSPELQRQLEGMSAYDMINQLKDIFQQQVRQEFYECVKGFLGCRMQEGGNVSVHVLKMKAYVDQMERLGFPIGRELAVDIILQSLPASYGQFIMDYHMHGMEKSLMELHGMLKTVESNMAKHDPASSIPVSAIKELRSKKKKLASKGKVGVTKSTLTLESESKEGGPQAVTPEEAVCYFCGSFGDWRRHACPKCLERSRMLNEKTVSSSSSGTFMINIYSSSTAKS